MSWRRNKDKPFRINLLDILLVLIVASVISLFVSWELFWFVGGFTAILFCIWLVMIWDDIAIWWSTRK